MMRTCCDIENPGGSHNAYQFKIKHVKGGEILRNSLEVL